MPADPERSKSYHCPILFRDWHRILNRYLMSRVTPAEFLLVEMVFDRTLSWGRLWCFISYDQFQNGIQGENENRVHDGTGLSQATIARLLPRLVKRGFLLSQRGRRGLEYRINYEGCRDLLPTPRAEEARKEVPQNEGRRSFKLRGMRPQNEIRGDTFGIENKERAKALKNKGVVELDRSTVLNFKKASESIKLGREATRKRRYEDLRDKVTLTACEAEELWNLAVGEESAIPWLSKERKALKNVMKGWKIPAGRFLVWTIKNWSRIIERDFDWMENPPVEILISFFVRWEDEFVSAYGCRKREEKLNSAKQKEREEKFRFKEREELAELNRQRFWLKLEKSR